MISQEVIFQVCRRDRLRDLFTEGEHRGMMRKEKKADGTVTGADKGISAACVIAGSVEIPLLFVVRNAEESILEVKNIRIVFGMLYDINRG